ncbi:hypothetical protein FALBO_4275 [Fusarium albosuccineum]|uniref:HNH nuclease domain-containing protein n=1 Tax=Fusarium albosuccineum TaxID=1237068 RepID=A0A8H4PKV4_9HYPO|nr:hypothetical protein FALBO_4275 [Fusarium albosuccineum]
MPSKIDEIAEIIRACSHDRVMLSSLMRYLTSQPEHEPPADLVPSDEYHERLEVLGQILRDQRALRDLPALEFTALQFPVLITLPVSRLKDLAKNPMGMRDNLEKLAPLFHDFLLFEPDNCRGVYPHRQQSSECLQRERHRCPISGLGWPEVYRIMRFSKKPPRSDLVGTSLLTKPLVSFFDVDLEQAAAAESLFGEMRTTELTWNMMALTPSLHNWIKHGCFAFKYLRSEPVIGSYPPDAEVRLQAHWMPRSTSSDPARFVNIQDQQDPEKRLLATLNHSYNLHATPRCDPHCRYCTENTGVAFWNSETNHPIQSGDIFTVRRAPDKVPYFKAMVDLQYAMIRAAAMSGAQASEWTWE